MPEAPTRMTLPTDRLSPPGDRERIDLYLGAFLAGSRKRFATNPHVRPLFDRASAFVLRGGKRLRPRLALASYRILTGSVEKPPRPAWLAAASLELFHAFMLVHDDLIDASLVRRDEPTLHEALRLDADWPDDAEGRKRSADLGLLAGDLLFALGMRLLGRSGLDDASFGRVHRQVADVLLDTGLGEALDVLYETCPFDDLDEAHLIDAYLRKTARYSVSGPMVLGATLAGAELSVMRSLRRFGDLLGLAFQIANDLEAIVAADPNGEISDLDGGKRTWVLATAHRRLGQEGRVAMAEALAMPVGPRRREQLLGLIDASGAASVCEARVKAIRREAMAVLRSSALDEPQKDAFQALIALFGASASMPAAV